MGSKNDLFFEGVFKKTGIKRVSDKAYAHQRCRPASLIGVQVKRGVVSVFFETDGRGNSLSSNALLDWASRGGILREEIVSGQYFSVRRGRINESKVSISVEVPYANENELTSDVLLDQVVGVVDFLRAKTVGLVDVAGVKTEDFPNGKAANEELSGTYETVYSVRFIEWKEPDDSPENTTEAEAIDLVNFSKSFLILEDEGCDNYLLYSGYTKSIYKAESYNEVIALAVQDVPDSDVVAGLAVSAYAEDVDGMYDVIDARGGSLEFTSETDHPYDYADRGYGCVYSASRGNSIQLKGLSSAPKAVIDAGEIDLGDIMGYIDESETRTVFYFD